MRLEVINLKVTSLVRLTAKTDVSDRGRSWQPGDMCYVFPRKQCLGTVIAVQDSESLLVLWSVLPQFTAEEKAVNHLAKQIGDEIDADILFDLHAAGLVSKKTVLEKFGLEDE